MNQIGVRSIDCSNATLAAFFRMRNTYMKAIRLAGRQSFANTGIIALSSHCRRHDPFACRHARPHCKRCRRRIAVCRPSDAGELPCLADEWRAAKEREPHRAGMRHRRGKHPARRRKTGLRRTAAVEDRRPRRTRAGADRGSPELRREEIVLHQWVDNGPGWAAVMLDSAEKVLSLRPNASLMCNMKLGVIGPYAKGAECDYEVRAFVAPLGVAEDPVTGSLNAGIAQWLIGSGLAKPNYVVSQGTALKRKGRVFVDQAGDDIWIGGEVALCIEGTACF